METIRKALGLLVLGIVLALTAGHAFAQTVEQVPSANYGIGGSDAPDHNQELNPKGF